MSTCCRIHIDIPKTWASDSNFIPLRNGIRICQSEPQQQRTQRLEHHFPLTPNSMCSPSWVSSQPILTGVKPRWVHDRLLVQFPVLLVQTHIIVGSLGINLLLRMMTQVDPSKGPRGQNKQAHRRKVNDLSSKWLPKSTTLWFDFFLRAKHWSKQASSCQWISLRENRNRKPSMFPFFMGVSGFNFP